MVRNTRHFTIFTTNKAATALDHQQLHFTTSNCTSPQATALHHKQLHFTTSNCTSPPAIALPATPSNCTSSNAQQALSTISTCARPTPALTLRRVWLSLLQLCAACVEKINVLLAEKLQFFHHFTSCPS